VLSGAIGRPVQVQTDNILGYVARKYKAAYKSHQNYVWAGWYKRHRYNYPEYMDIITAIFLFTAFRSNNDILAQYFLKTLYKPLRIMYKLKKFFWFLSDIIKGYPLIRRQFRIFRILLVGKIAGGTKRTKIFKIGYGRLVLQTLSKNSTMSFKSFDHRFGEFGIKLIVTRRDGLHKDLKTELLKIDE